ncbi:putative ribonuclease H-like domain-containing protein [Tanacetum coccineum]
MGFIVRNKARLVAQGHTQEESIDYDEVFAPVARIEAIRLFLAYASFMDFIVYQMDVKSAFLYGTKDEEVYVSQPPGFEDPQFPHKVYKVEKALYGLHQAQDLDKYMAEILKKFDFSSVKTASTPMEPNKALVKDSEAEDVDVHLLTPKISHLHAVKMIFRYLKGQPNLGLWYPKDSPFDLEAYSYSDYAGASLDRKSTTGGCQFLGKRLISWQCKKQTIVANLTTEAEYVVAANCCGQVLWIQNQILDYGFNFMKTKIYIDNESTICIVKNLVFHSKTKHIEIRHHFIRDSYEKRLIEVLKINTDQNVADLLTKGFDVSRGTTVIDELKVNAVSQELVLSVLVGKDLMLSMQVNAVRHKLMLMEVNAVRAALTTVSGTHNMIAFLEKPTKSKGFEQVIDFLNASCIHYALTVNPTVYVSHITQFWTSAQVKKVNRVTELQALVDGKPIVVSEAFIRRLLKFNDEGGIDCLPNATIFEEIGRMRYEKMSQKLTFYKAFFSPQWKFLIHTFLQCLSAKTTAWIEFSSIAASAIICLSTNQKFNFSKFILEGMIRNLDAKDVKFLMYPRFVHLFVNQLEGLPVHHRQYKVPCHTKKIFASMKRKNADFSGTVTPLFPTMVVQPPLSPPPATTTSPTPPPVSTKRTPLPLTIPPTIETTPPPTITTPISSPQASPIPTTSTQPSTQPSKQRSNDPPGGEDRLKLTELMDLCTTLQAKVLDLEKTKASQQQKIESLDRRVKKLEKDKKKRTHKLKRLYKVGLSARVISSDDEEPDLEVQEDEFK